MPACQRAAGSGLASDDRRPLRLDLAGFSLVLSGHDRELVDPREGTACVDYHFRMRRDSPFLVRLGDAGIERRAPSAPNDIHLLGWFATRGDRPHDIVEI